MRVSEVTCRSILTKSGIPGADYCVNPYVGCSHACVYCYATFMMRFTNHEEPWGTFVDARVNSPEVLRRQLKTARRGQVMVSSVTDAYQPIEVKHRLTRRCLEALRERQFPVGILTKSPLVLRDIDLFRGFESIEVGLTITTDDERMRRIFEPKAPPIMARVNALRKLREQGIRTYVFIGPLLPMDPEALARLIRPHADSILISRMNYIGKTASLYRRHGISQWLERSFTGGIIDRFRHEFGRDRAGIC